MSEKQETRPVALITGARRGIGRVIALRLARDADIVVNDIADGKDELEAVADEVRALGSRALAVTGRRRSRRAAAAGR